MATQLKGHGKWAICHGMYAGYVTNASMENLWRDKHEICPELLDEVGRKVNGGHASTSTLGTFLDGLVR